MSSTDTETQSPVEASNASAALPGVSGSGPAPSSPAGGAMAASGLQDGSTTYSQPYATSTTPVSAGSPFINAAGEPYNPAQRAQAKPIDDADAEDRTIDDGDAAKAYLVSVANPGGSMERQGVNVAIGRLHPAFAVGLANTVQQARAEGIPAGPFSSYRDPVLDPGGFADKWNSLHGYGLAVDVAGIGAAGSSTARRFHEIATENGIFNPYGPNNAAEFNHFQGVELRGRQFREANPQAEVALRAFRSAGSPGATPPDPNLRPDTNAPAFGAAGARDLPNDAPEPTGVPGAYAASPELLALWQATGIPLDGGRLRSSGEDLLLAGGVTPRARSLVAESAAFGASGARAMPEPPSTAAMSVAILDQGRFLQRGSKGDAAAEWQRFLNTRGFGLVVDGDFGRATRAATREFQAESDIEVDGIVGAETYRAALYLLDPTAGPRSDAQVAYADGANAAEKIIEPGASARREVDIALPRARPERGAGIPDPPQNPRRQTAQWSDVDAMTEVDTAGNYVRDRNAPRILFGPADIGRMASDFREGLVADGITGDRLDKQVARYEQRLKASGSFRYASGQTPAEIGRMVSDFRDGLIEDGVSGAILDRAVTMFETSAKRQIARDQRVADASRAGAQATRQRLSDARTKDDRFRPRARAADTRTQDEIMLIRSSEAVREFARGIGDRYRKFLAQQQSAMSAEELRGGIANDMLVDDGKTAFEREQIVTDMMLRSAPTPVETVTQVYAFGGGVPSSLLEGIMQRLPGNKPPITPEWREQVESWAKEGEGYALTDLRRFVPLTLSEDDAVQLAREYGDEIRRRALYDESVLNTYGGRQLAYFGERGADFFDWLSFNGYSALVAKFNESALPEAYRTGGRF